MPYPIPSTNGHASAGRYGLASVHDFDNPGKWHTVSNVPLLDEHEITGPNGEPETVVDRHVLAEIARNNNRRVIETGDPATLILGHTSDDPRAPEKPAKGFAVNYRVRPFKRDPKTGQVTYAIFSDIKVRPRNAHLLEEYPRRSVELWLSKREIDPIALLGGTTPERDLSVLIRKARLTNVNLEHNPKTALERKEAALAAEEAAIHYRARFGTLYRYAMEGCMPRHIDAQPSSHYGDDDFEGDTDDVGAGDDTGSGDDDAGGGFDGGADDGGGEDPVVAKVLASKPMRDLMDKVNQIFEAVSGGGGDPAGGDMGGDPMGAPQPGGAGAGPMGAGAGAPPPGPPGGMGGPPGAGSPDEEAAMFHGSKPVRFEDGFGDDEPDLYEAGSGFGGPTSASVPGTNFGGGGKRPFSRNGSNNGRGNVNGTQRRPVQGQQQQQRPVSQTDERVRRLERSNRELVLKLARADSEKLIGQLEAEGILFGDTLEEATREKTAKIEMLAHCDERTRGFIVADMRKNYRRVESTPAAPGYPSATQYARSVPPGRDDAPGGADENDFNPATPAEAMEYAAAIRSMGPEKAVKFMRDKGKRGNQHRR